MPLAHGAWPGTCAPRRCAHGRKAHREVTVLDLHRLARPSWPCCTICLPTATTVRTTSSSSASTRICSRPGPSVCCSWYSRCPSQACASAQGRGPCLTVPGRAEGVACQRASRSTPQDPNPAAEGVYLLCGTAERRSMCAGSRSARRTGERPTAHKLPRHCSCRHTHCPGRCRRGYWCRCRWTRRYCTAGIRCCKRYCSTRRPRNCRSGIPVRWSKALPRPSSAHRCCHCNKSPKRTGCWWCNW